MGVSENGTAGQASPYLNRNVSTVGTIGNPGNDGRMCGGTATLASKIAARRAVVGIVGQGYVGFPLAQQAARCGYTTYGHDVNLDTIARCEAENRSRRYRPVVAVAALRACDVIIVAVPTPTRRLERGYEPDLSLVTGAISTLATHVLNDGRPRLLIVESTYAPGTTRRMVAPIVAEHCDLGHTVFLGYSPERIDPGNTRFDLVNTPKITSGHDQEAAKLTQLFYSQIVDRAVPASSLEAAEATKILENTFRFINIAFAQEFETYCEQIGLDAREITNLAATKPFGYMPFFAGAGIGGHCIAEDPYFLEQAMRSAASTPTILRAALENHEGRAGVLVERIRRRLGRPLAGARILLLGVSYKPDIGDARRSPALPMLEQLERGGADVAYHDSFVPRFAGRTSIGLDGADPSAFDLAVVVTRHTDVDYHALRDAGWQLYDVTGVLRPTLPPGKERGRVSSLLESMLPGRTQSLVEIGS